MILNVSVAIISILWLNGSTMSKIHEIKTSQGVLPEDREQRRLAIQAQDHTGATSENAISTVKIQLTQGKVALIDSSDFSLVKDSPWCFDGHYAARGKKFSIRRMHVLIMSPEKGMLVDHINGNKLDNRRSNLRVVTTTQNTYNKRLSNLSTSGHRGVYWNKQCKKWIAQISHKNKVRYLGSFSEIKDACNARDLEAKRVFGEFHPTD